MSLSVGDNVTINGLIHYAQDHKFFEFVFPTDLIFTVKLAVTDYVSLSAPGYGEIGGKYGDGAIFVYKKYWSNLRLVEP